LPNQPPESELCDALLSVLLSLDHVLRDFVTRAAPHLLGTIHSDSGAVLGLVARLSEAAQQAVKAREDMVSADETLQSLSHLADTFEAQEAALMRALAAVHEREEGDEGEHDWEDVAEGEDLQAQLDQLRSRWSGRGDEEAEAKAAMASAKAALTMAAHTVEQLGRQPQVAPLFDVINTLDLETHRLRIGQCAGVSEDDIAVARGWDAEEMIVHRICCAVDILQSVVEAELTPTPETIPGLKLAIAKFKTFLDTHAGLDVLPVLCLVSDAMQDDDEEEAQGADDDDDGGPLGGSGVASCFALLIRAAQDTSRTFSACTDALVSLKEHEADLALRQRLLSQKRWLREATVTLHSRRLFPSETSKLDTSRERLIAHLRQLLTGFMNASQRVVDLETRYQGQHSSAMQLLSRAGASGSLVGADVAFAERGKHVASLVAVRQQVASLAEGVVALEELRGGNLATQLQVMYHDNVVAACSCLELLVVNQNDIVRQVAASDVAHKEDTELAHTQSEREALAQQLTPSLTALQEQKQRALVCVEQLQPEALENAARTIALTKDIEPLAESAVKVCEEESPLRAVEAVRDVAVEADRLRQCGRSVKEACDSWHRRAQRRAAETEERETEEEGCTEEIEDVEGDQLRAVAVGSAQLQQCLMSLGDLATQAAAALHDVATGVVRLEAVEPSLTTTGSKDDRNSRALVALHRVKTRLQGRIDGRKCTVAAQVDTMLGQAMSPDLLSVMYEGWMAWI